MYVTVSTSSGHKYLQYYSGNGTSYEDGSGNVCFYLGSGASSSVWNRFERNIEEDWESLSAATWTNTDGLLIRPDSTASYDFYIDHLRFSNSRTKIHNTLSGSNIGQIVSAKNYMSDSYGQPENVWHSYDHIGNVMNLSDAAGDKTTEYAQDAFGNVLSSATTGAWASSASGRHLTTKEYDDNVDFYYFWQRWYDPTLVRFLSKAPFPPNIEHPYSYAMNLPIKNSDSSGAIVQVCVTDAWDVPFLNHVFFHNTETGQSCGTSGFFGRGDPVGDHADRSLNECYDIEGSDDKCKGDCLMDHCRENANNGMYLPLINDCHSAVHDALRECGLDYPSGAPGRVDYNPVPDLPPHGRPDPQ